MDKLGKNMVTVSNTSLSIQYCIPLLIFREFKKVCRNDLWTDAPFHLLLWWLQSICHGQFCNTFVGAGIPYQVKSIQARGGLNWFDLIGSPLILTWNKTKPAWLTWIPSHVNRSFFCQHAFLIENLNVLLNFIAIYLLYFCHDEKKILCFNEIWEKHIACTGHEEFAWEMHRSDRVELHKSPRILLSAVSVDTRPVPVSNSPVRQSYRQL